MVPATRSFELSTILLHRSTRDIGFAALGFDVWLRSPAPCPLWLSAAPHGGHRIRVVPRGQISYTVQAPVKGARDLGWKGRVQTHPIK